MTSSEEDGKLDLYCLKASSDVISVTLACAIVRFRDGSGTRKLVDGGGEMRKPSDLRICPSRFRD